MIQSILVDLLPETTRQNREMCFLLENARNGRIPYAIPRAYVMARFADHAYFYARLAIRAASRLASQDLDEPDAAGLAQRAMSDLREEVSEGTVRPPSSGEFSFLLQDAVVSRAEPAPVVPGSVSSLDPAAHDFYVKHFLFTLDHGNVRWLLREKFQLQAREAERLDSLLAARIRESANRRHLARIVLARLAPLLRYSLVSRNGDSLDEETRQKALAAYSDTARDLGFPSTHDDLAEVTHERVRLHELPAAGEPLPAVLSHAASTSGRELESLSAAELGRGAEVEVDNLFSRVDGTRTDMSWFARLMDELGFEQGDPEG